MTSTWRPEARNASTSFRTRTSAGKCACRTTQIFATGQPGRDRSLEVGVFPGPTLQFLLHRPDVTLRARIVPSPGVHRPDRTPKIAGPVPPAPSATLRHPLRAAVVVIADVARPVIGVERRGVAGQRIGAAVPPRNILDLHDAPAL